MPWYAVVIALIVGVGGYVVAELFPEEDPN